MAAKRCLSMTHVVVERQSTQQQDLGRTPVCVCALLHIISARGIVCEDPD